MTATTMGLTTTNRGRPAGRMTPRRAQVLAEITARAQAGERIRTGEVMRRCGLHDGSAVRRIMRDLRAMGRWPGNGEPQRAVTN